MMPSARLSTMSASGSVGSIQWLCRPTSTSRPHCCSIANHSTKAGSGSSSSRSSIATKPPSFSSPRRLSERATASMRARSELSSSPASSSSFFSELAASASIGRWRSRSCAASIAASRSRPSISGSQSVSSVWPPAFSGPRQHLLADQRQEELGLAFRRSRLDALLPAGAWQDARRGGDLLERASRPSPRRRRGRRCGRRGCVRVCLVASGPRIQRLSSAVSSAVR